MDNKLGQEYNQSYYEAYDIGSSKVSYEHSQELKDFMGHVADEIVDNLHPKTVLDAGCAMGFLVAALRDRGVEAYGIDVSEYAISRVREDIRPFCRVHSADQRLPEDMPGHYDLVVTIEVLEHLEENDGIRMVQNLCRYSDTILFSSTPEQTAEPTHLNIQFAEYWAKQFAQEGFYKDLFFDASFVSFQAALFIKKECGVQLIEDYEKAYRKCCERQKELDREVKELREMLAQETEKFREKEDQAVDLLLKNKTLTQENEDYSKQFLILHSENEKLSQQAQDLYIHYNSVINSTAWKVTKPFRMLGNGVKRMLNSNRATQLLLKGVKSLLHDGIRATLRKTKTSLNQQSNFKQFAKHMLPKKEQLEKERQEKFPVEIKFSILVPLYNTPISYLEEMIDSVIAQTYPNWELCLADGSDAEHGEVGERVLRYTQQDSRIRYRKLEKNLGIADNTNACIEMATGDYIALFDHDDVLHPSVLFEDMKAITNQQADFIYTDEMTFSETLDNALTVHCKPDFAIDNLRANNYICHFSVFSRELLDRAGWFDHNYDGSQDYDIILRLTEQAKHIVHIPKVLYFWRSHPGSVASDISAKPYCITSAKKALNDHLKRCGLEGEAVDAPRLTSIYRIAYKVQGEPLISIIIPNKDHIPDLTRCIYSIIEKSTYQNYEIIVVENNSEQKETFEYYEILEKRQNIQVVKWEREFNYAAINNFGRGFAKGEYLLFLNNDVEVITPDWMQEMLMYAQRKDVGAVGAKLYYPDDTIQHAGVVVGILGTAGHIHYRFDKSNLGYMGRLYYAQDFSAVTAACMMMSASAFDEVGGFDERFVVAYNDVDLCLRVRQSGKLVVFTPFAELYHYESKTRGDDRDKKNKDRFKQEQKLFISTWKEFLDRGDPYFNPNFSLEREDFYLKTE